MSELRAVFFDVNDTLWDRTACDQQVMQIVVDRYAEHFPEDDAEPVIRRFNAVLFELFGRHHMRERRSLSHRRRFEALLDAYGVPGRALAREMARTFDTTRRLMMRQFLRPEALKLLWRLGHRKLQRGVIMNGQPAVQRHLLQTLGLRQHLDHTLLAEVEGHHKPDVRLFRRTLELLGLDAEQMLYVGDSPLTDILGAARAGIPTVWFNPGQRRLPRGWPTPDFTIHDLAELYGVIEV